MVGTFRWLLVVGMATALAAGCRLSPIEGDDDDVGDDDAADDDAADDDAADDDAGDDDAGDDDAGDDDAADDDAADDDAADDDDATSGCDVSVPGDESTIQAAVARVSDHGTVCVGNGVYAENVFIDHPLVLRSDNGASVTTIDANYSSRPLHITADDVGVIGFTITGGSGEICGGGVYTQKADRVLLQDNVVTSNSASYGAGICVHQSNDATLEGNTVTGNSCQEYGAGVRILSSSGATLDGNTIRQNVTSDGGGGMHLDNAANLVMTSTTITDNTATWAGGVLCDNSSYVVVGNTIEDNTPDNMYCIGCSPCEYY